MSRDQGFWKNNVGFLVVMTLDPPQWPWEIVNNSSLMASRDLYNMNLVMYIKYVDYNMYYICSL